MDISFSINLGINIRRSPLSHMLMPRLMLRLMSMLRLPLSHTLMSRFQLRLTFTLSQLLPQLVMLDTSLPPHTLDTDMDMPQLLTQHWLLPQSLPLLKLPEKYKLTK